MDIENSEEIIFHENLVALLMLKLSLSGADSLARGWGWELCSFFQSYFGSIWVDSMKSHNQYSPSWDAHWLILKSPIFPLTKSLLHLSTIWGAGTCHGSMGTPGSSFSLWTNDDATSKTSQLIWSTFPLPAPAVSSQMEEDISLPTWTVSQMRQDTEKLWTWRGSMIGSFCP